MTGKTCPIKFLKQQDNYIILRRMRYTWLLAVIIIVVFILIISNFFGFFKAIIPFQDSDDKPTVTITYPVNGAKVSRFVMISGTASNPDIDVNITSVEIRVNENAWMTATGTDLWSYDWTTYLLQDGEYTISARSYNGMDYSAVETITITVDNPTSVDSDSHKWALFIAAANFPVTNETKLGNGGLYLAEDIAAHLIENKQFPTKNVMILFDDGWIRSNNGYGVKEQTLQERPHDYDITYGSATKANVVTWLQVLINESNAYEDSEVFIWIFNHGAGNSDKSLTGGKILQNSEIFFWDDTMTDRALGDLLLPLESKKVAIIIDACYAGGFADRTIFNLRTFLLLRSHIPGDGRVIITGTSKFRSGYASTTQGPVFSLLWFEGLSTGKADGYRAGLFDRGVSGNLKMFQDGVVSVEEAFYYARVMLRTDDNLKDFRSMQPQINDRFPHRGFLRSLDGLVL